MVSRLEQGDGQGVTAAIDLLLAVQTVVVFLFDVDDEFVAALFEQLGQSGQVLYGHHAPQL